MTKEFLEKQADTSLLLLSDYVRRRLLNRKILSQGEQGIYRRLRVISNVLHRTERLFKHLYNENSLFGEETAAGLRIVAELNQKISSLTDEIKNAGIKKPGEGFYVNQDEKLQNLILEMWYQNKDERIRFCTTEAEKEQIYLKAKRLKMSFADYARYKLMRLNSATPSEIVGLSHATMFLDQIIQFGKDFKDAFLKSNLEDLKRCLDTQNQFKEAFYLVKRDMEKIFFTKENNRNAA